MSGRFGRRERLTGRTEFQAVFQQGKRVDRPALIVRWRESAGPRRVGFAVSRQVRTAVRRNRVRRRLREAYRRTRDGAPGDVLLVVIGRPAAFGIEFGALVAEMRNAFSMIPGRRAS